MPVRNLSAQFFKTASFERAQRKTSFAAIVEDLNSSNAHNII